MKTEIGRVSKLERDRLVVEEKDQEEVGTKEEEEEVQDQIKEAVEVEEEEDQIKVALDQEAVLIYRRIKMEMEKLVMAKLVMAKLEMEKLEMVKLETEMERRKTELISHPVKFYQRITKNYINKILSLNLFFFPLIFLNFNFVIRNIILLVCF